MKHCANGFNCPVGVAIDLIGGKYKPLILWHLSDGTLRFNELHKIIPQATPRMLTQQLRELEEAEIVSRVVYPVVPPKVEYSLTEFGKTLIPIMRAMYNWGENYLADRGEAANCSMKTNEKRR